MDPVKWIIIAALGMFGLVVTLASKQNGGQSQNVTPSPVPMTPQGVPLNPFGTAGSAAGSLASAFSQSFAFSDLFTSDGIPKPLFDARTGDYTGPGGPNATLAQIDAAVSAQENWKQ